MALEPKKHCPSCKKDLAISEFRKNPSQERWSKRLLQKVRQELQLIFRRSRGQLTAQSASGVGASWKSEYRLEPI
jgi:hypothetical protein